MSLKAFFFTEFVVDVVTVAEHTSTGVRIDVHRFGKLLPVKKTRLKKLREVTVHDRKLSHLKVEDICYNLSQ
jgi:hypothetical protein